MSTADDRTGFGAETSSPKRNERNQARPKAAPNQCGPIVIPPLITVWADKAYDNNDLRTTIADMNAEAVIPSTRSRKVPIPHDETIYKLRNRIERCFNKLKHFRRFATRYDRRADDFLAFVHLAAICIWLR
ncbi:transposase [Bradyrhizobium quebecense]|uniref:Transposase n=2 Tax=Bradyrhizobium quebecense TaxID=2748629 RepID=A0ACD3VLN8_9BRAD|nr:transposase [Bradyrhizobium quebecense]UGY07369.1 transposase [Bradyrhizobium quebecense]